MLNIVKLALIGILTSEQVQAVMMLPSYQCNQCLAAGQRACLSQDAAGKVDYTTYTCCTPNSLAKKCWGTDPGFQGGYKYCSTKINEAKKSFTPVVSQDLRQFTCPMVNTDNCDAAVDIVINAEGTEYKRTKQWDFMVPTAAAANWNCKYKISLDTAQGLVAKDNFLMVQIEQYGFEEVVTVMSQPAGQKNIVDWISNTDANGVRVYQADFSQKFFVPASNDILISYAPVRNKPGPQQDITSYMGRIRLKAQFVKGIDGKLSDENSRDARTVADANVKFFKIADVCPPLANKDDCTNNAQCAWDTAKCAKKVIVGDKCPNYNNRAAECAKDNTCFYKEGVCAIKTGCDAQTLQTKTKCATDKTCSWTTKCFTTPPKQCKELLKKDTCTTDRDDCAWDEKTTKCGMKLKACSSYQKESTCNSLLEAIKQGDTRQFNKCTWTKFACGAIPQKKTVVVPCGNNNEAKCGTEAKCSWVAAVKDTAGKVTANPYCKDKAPINCESFTKSTECTATAVKSICTWTAATTKCTATPPPQCSDNKSKTTCGNAKCNWSATDSSCSDFPACASTEDSATCTSNTKCYVVTKGNLCIDTPTEVNWDNEIVVKTAWYDQTLFELFDGGLRVTSGMALGLVVGIIVVAVIVSAVLSYIAYIKREKIAVEMRRVSEYASRTSTKIRNTLSGRPQEQPVDPNEKIKPANQLQKDMFAEHAKKGDVEMADKDKEMGAEEEHQFGDKAADPKVQADIDGKQEVAGNIYADADDENIRGTKVGGPAKPE